jgi:hypothetical protein
MQRLGDAARVRLLVDHGAWMSICARGFLRVRGLHLGGLFLFRGRSGRLVRDLALRYTLGEFGV